MSTGEGHLFHDDFLAKRIRFFASKHDFDNEVVYRLWEDLTDQQFKIMNAANFGMDSGYPVLVLGDVQPNWTVLTTRKLFSNFQDETVSVELFRIVGFESNKELSKDELEYLDLVLEDGSKTRVWGPAGSPYYAMWNILLCLSRMNLTDGKHFRKLS